MNLYLVVSESLSCWPRMGADYRIAELVVARNHGQAKYLAWKNDKDSFPAWGHTDMADMPMLDELINRLEDSNAHLAMAKGLVMKQKPSFFLVMIGTYAGVAASIISVALDLVRKEKKEPCNKP